MKRHPSLIAEILAYISLYVLLVVLLVGGGLACHFVFYSGSRLANSNPPPPVTREVSRLAKLPTAPAANQPPPAEPVVNPPAQSATVQSAPILPTAVSQAAPSDASAAVLPPPTVSQPPVVESAPVSAAPAPANLTPAPLPALDMRSYAGIPAATRAPHSSPTPTPAGILDNLVSGLIAAIEEATPVIAAANQPLPTLTPTPTATPTFTPSPTATDTSTPTPTPAPTLTPTATPSPVPTASATPTDTPPPTLPPPTPLPTATPLPTVTPLPAYDFMLAEFFNSPTTNSFLVMYVAIVDINEIPIGDLKIVGTRKDHNLTYDSPLSTWYFEGYNAPGAVTKSGNVKFEPPGGIEDTAWVLYLADGQGTRLSDDVPFDTTQADKQWYFIKFRRKY